MVMEKRQGSVIKDKKKISVFIYEEKYKKLRMTLRAMDLSVTEFMDCMITEFLESTEVVVQSKDQNVFIEKMKDNISGLQLEINEFENKQNKKGDNQ